MTTDLIQNDFEDEIQDIVLPCHLSSGKPVLTKEQQNDIRKYLHRINDYTVIKALVACCEPSGVLYKAIKDGTKRGNTPISAKLVISICKNFNIDLDAFRFENGQTYAHKLMHPQQPIRYESEILFLAKSLGLSFCVKDDNGNLPIDIYKNNINAVDKRKHLINHAFYIKENPSNLETLYNLEQAGATFHQNYSSKRTPATREQQNAFLLKLTEQQKRAQKPFSESIMLFFLSVAFVVSDYIQNKYKQAFTSKQKTIKNQNTH